ncbi:ATP-binding cassette domain-containing protein [Rubrobacter tropicus]|uniref:ATP-binding cassette domain-containing protein n=1 Tax=Rubrobacter tropicus TaxID=2653851 RepID=A0A6G8QAR7_9ACTN|nr:ATP-binding cassette domain-containing protein [Rubrobacter tropicus]QIN83580.1 ATP-binding cassette domain-containing protein [Rubrobacter tropicus]
MRGVLLEDVSVGFDGVAALSDVTLHIEAGEQLAVIGASGAGKSTLFRALTRSVALGRGRVVVDGQDLYSLPRRRLGELRRRIGTIYQAYNLVPQLSAGVNVSLGEVGEMGRLGTLRAFFAGPDAGLSKKARAALEQIGLGDKAGVRTADLSGGQQQRVAVARLLVQRPDLILADEPFAAVDPVTTERVLQTLLHLNREGATLLANLHDVEVARRFPRVVALRAGRVAFDGPPGRLTEDELAKIYEGDPGGDPGGSENGEGSDLPYAGYGAEGSFRLTEGRDGVSSH